MKDSLCLFIVGACAVAGGVLGWLLGASGIPASIIGFFASVTALQAALFGAAFIGSLGFLLALVKANSKTEIAIGTTVMALIGSAGYAFAAYTGYFKLKAARLEYYFQPLFLAFYGVILFGLLGLLLASSFESKSRKR